MREEEDEDTGKDAYESDGLVADSDLAEKDGTGQKRNDNIAASHGG